MSSFPRLAETVRHPSRSRRAADLLGGRRWACRFFRPEEQSLTAVPGGETVAAPHRATWSISTATAHHFWQVHVWTAEEWAGLAAKPADAQETGGGLWVALRIDG